MASGSVTRTARPSRTTGLSCASRATRAASMPGSGRPMEPGRISVAAKFEIMMPPVSVCHQLSCTGWPKASLAPHHHLRVERLADAGHKAQGGQVMPDGPLRPGLHQHPQRGGGGVPDRDVLLGEDPVPAVRVHFLLVHNARHAVAERGEDAVGRPGHPAGIGGAPVDVVRMQVQREGAGRVVGGDGVVDVDGALGRAGGAGREVQQGHVLGPGRHDLPVRGGCLHQPFQVQGARLRLAVGVGQQHMPQFGQRAAQLRHLPPVERPGGDEHPAGAQLQPLPHGLRSEGREQRAEHARVLEGAEHRDVEGGGAAAEREDALAAPDAEAAQHRGEPAALLGQLPVGERVAGPVGADEPQRLPAAASAGHVPVRGLEGDVQAPAAGQSGQFPAGVLPGEGRAGRVIIQQVGPDPEAARVLGDRRPAGGGFGSCRHAYIGRPPRAGCQCRKSRARAVPGGTAPMPHAAVRTGIRAAASH